MSQGYISHTMDQRGAQGANVIPTNIISGTYINSNIIVHSKHIEQVPGTKVTKSHTSNNRHSSIQDERKVVPNDHTKPVIASGGHMRGGSYDMNVLSSV
mmetsp:Transcript_7098/g.5356  ORF Transcript_7098/g.5356 Transcript_7098/m.5356 type:complete len:99 (-) Transcript_7098:389-685(-)